MPLARALVPRARFRQWRTARPDAGPPGAARAGGMALRQTKRRRALLRVFGSAKRVREAPVEQIAAVPGIGAALAARIKQTLEA